VALVDPSDLRRAQRQIEWPAAQAFASVGELITSGTEIHAAELLLPTTLTRRSSWPVDAGLHVNLQKPFANDLASAQRMADEAERRGLQLRVMENYCFMSRCRS